MKRLMKLNFFSMLSENIINKPYLVSLQEAYEELALKILEKLENEDNLLKLYYELGFIRLELVDIQLNNSNRKEKKCIRFYLKSNPSY